MASIKVTFDDNSQDVLRELEKDTEKALFAIGLLGVEGCVQKASDIDAETGRPTVDTGRYRAGFGFITPQEGKMSGTPASAKEPEDDISAHRAPKDTVIIANNVEYAEYLEFGSGTKKGGKHARYIMKRGIEGKFDDMQTQTQEILEGKNVGLSVTLPTEV